MERMREYCKKENEPFPKIEFTDNYFYIVFKPTKSYLKRVVGAKVGVKLTDREKEIIEFIHKNQKIDSSDLQNLFSISRTMANKYFNKLIKKKLIIRKESRKINLLYYKTQVIKKGIYALIAF